MINPPSLDEPEPLFDQLAAIAGQPGTINPLQPVCWEMRDGKLVHIFDGIVLDTRPWESQWNCNRITLLLELPDVEVLAGRGWLGKFGLIRKFRDPLAGSKVAGRALP
jgi:hypothetical protein